MNFLGQSNNFVLCLHSDIDKGNKGRSCPETYISVSLLLGPPVANEYLLWQEVLRRFLPKDFASQVVQSGCPRWFCNSKSCPILYLTFFLAAGQD